MAERVSSTSQDEIPESTADQRIAGLYAQIRAVSGLQGINLFYRRLAYAGADVLTEFWDQVSPLYHSRRLHQAGAVVEHLVTLPAVACLDGPLLEASGVARDERAAVRATLRYFNRANAMHLALFSGLSHVLDDTGRDVTAVEHDNITESAANGEDELLPLVPFTDTPVASQVLVAAIRDRLAPNVNKALIPTLLRHFAPYPVLIGSLYGYVASHNEALLRAIDASRTDALRVGKPLFAPDSVTFSEPVRAIVDTTGHEFRQIIPTMLVLGTAMARGLTSSR